jgi:two-component system LytT family sensor kinase
MPTLGKEINFYRFTMSSEKKAQTGSPARMDPTMNRKLTIYALVSSPLLALFGISPFYIFGVLPLEASTFLFGAVFLNIAIYWALNGYLFFKATFKRTWVPYLISYLGAFVSKFIFLFFDETLLEFRETMQQYILYPAVNTIAVNTLVLFMINSIKNAYKKQQADQTIAELMIENLTAQKFTLTQQLQPHFLFNALSILKSLIRENAELAEAYAIKLSEFLRYSVESSSEELVPVKDEMKFVQNYIDLQKIRFENSFDFQVEIEDRLQAGKVPVFAIQTLVENAFKHNYFTEKKPMTITIRSIGDQLHISNNIVSLKVTERAGTGLKNLQKRYELFGGQEVSITQTQDQFTVQIPVIKE